MRRDWQAFAFAHTPIVLLLAALTVLYATTLNAHGMFEWDEAEYASLARSAMRGEGFSISGRPNSLRPPVLPLSGAAAMLLSRSSEDRVLKRCSLIFSALALFVVYWGTARQYDRDTGFVAAALLGLSPLFWTSTPHFMAEIPFMAFFTAAVLCFYFGVYDDARCFLWSWLWFALALLTRYTAVLFVPIVTAMLAVALVTGGATVRRRLFSRRFIFSPIVALVVLAPWFIREQLTFGDALIGLKRSSTQLLVYLPRVSMPWHFYLSGLPEMLSLVVVFFALGIVWAAWRRDRFGLHWFAVAAGILVWFSCYRYKETRLVTSVLPFVAIVAALGVTRLLATPAVRRGVVIPVAIAAVFGLGLFNTRATFTNSVTLGYPAFYVAMQFVRTYASVKGVVVGANYPQIFWYADRQAIDFPPTEAELKTMLERVEWVIVTDFERGQPPWVAPLVKKLSHQDVRDGNVMEFRDERFVTYVIRADLLQKRL